MKNQLSIMHLAVMCALTPALALVSGCGNGGKAAEKGEAALREGKYSAAAKSLDFAARKTQPTSHLYYNLGSAKALSGDLPGAIRAFETAESMDLANLDAIEFRAKVLADKGDLATAHELLDRVVDEASDASVRVRILNALAVVEHRLHRDDLACVRLAQVIRMDPEYAPAYYNFAHFLEEAYQLHAAALANILKFDETAKADNPVRAKAEEFKALVEAADKLAPIPAPHATTAEANKLIKQGADAYARSKWTLAEETFSKALEVDPESYEAASFLAATRYAARHYDAAAEAYAKAAEFAPTQFDPVFMQGHIAYSLGNAARAIQILTGVAIPRWPDNPKSYEIASYALAKERRYYEARVYGAVYIELSKAEGSNVSAFEKWFESLPQIAFVADK